MTMKTITVSIELDDMLREHLDNCATVKPNEEIPEQLKKKWTTSPDRLTDTEKILIHGWIRSQALTAFLNSKEELVVPESALHKLGKILLDDMDDVKLRFAYQDFYAYQFLDKLQDIVRRASLVKDKIFDASIPDSIRKLCREAYLTCIYGYHTASIALCRAILEGSLQSYLGKDTGGLGFLNDEAKRSYAYGHDVWKKIDAVRSKGGRALHRFGASKGSLESINLEVLELTQEILVKLKKK